MAERRWIPAPRDAAGELIVPRLRLVRDVVADDEGRAAA
jgi:hypothetical protein